MNNVEGEQQQKINVGNIDLMPVQDGSAAVCLINLFGMFEQRIVIPRPIVLAFLKNWIANEKQVQDINKAITNIRRIN